VTARQQAVYVDSHFMKSLIFTYCFLLVNSCIGQSQSHRKEIFNIIQPYRPATIILLRDNDILSTMVNGNSILTMSDTVAAGYYKIRISASGQKTSETELGQLSNGQLLTIIITLPVHVYLTIPSIIFLSVPKNTQTT